MTLPKHSPALPLSHDDSYEGNIRCYGKPPKGYRWLKVGDPVSEKTLMVSWGSFIPYNKDWAVPRDKVALNEWPAIEPIAKPAKAKPVKAKPVKAKPETVGDLRRDALVLEVVERTKTDVTFRIIKQRYRDVDFRAEDGLRLETMNYPAVYSNALYLRGTDGKSNRDLLSCDTKKFERITAAVNEYNESVRPKSAPKPAPAPITPLAQIKALLSADPEIAADVMRECIRVIADRN